VVQAQVHNGAELYIGDNSILHIDSGSFNFGSGTITTSRTTSNYGYYLWGWRILDRASTKRFVDGYVQTAVPQPSFYQYILVLCANSSNLNFEGVDAAYFRSTPNSIGSVLESISSISSIEYWDIKVRE
jgi:hypothetical protein